MSRFQPLSGPGWKVNKQAGTVEQVRAEIQRRIGALANGNQVTAPPIVPADRGRYSANWKVEDWSGVPGAHRDVVQAEVVTVMRAWEVDE